MLHQRLVALAYCWVLVCAPALAQQQPTNSADVLSLARQSYYNLPKEGLVQYRCSVVPDWQIMLSTDLHADVPSDHPAIRILSGIHFAVSLDQSGVPTLTHKVDIEPANPQAQQGIQHTIAGVGQVLSEFYQSVAPFLFTSMLPKPGDKYSFDSRGKQHFLSFKESANDVSITLREDLTVSETKVVSPQQIATMRPQFSKTEKGFLIVRIDIDSDYKLPNDASLTNLVMDIEYASIQGFQLPSKLTVNIKSRDATHKMVFAFADYEVRKQE